MPVGPKSHWELEKESKFLSKGMNDHPAWRLGRLCHTVKPNNFLASQNGDEKNFDTVHATYIKWNCKLQGLSIFHACNQELNISITVVYDFCFCTNVQWYGAQLYGGIQWIQRRQAALYLNRGSNLQSMQPVTDTVLACRQQLRAYASSNWHWVPAVSHWLFHLQAAVLVFRLQFVTDNIFCKIPY